MTLKSSVAPSVAPTRDDDSTEWAHLFEPEALAFSKATGVACRAFCGVWEQPFDAAPVEHDFPDEVWEDTCPDCLDWWRRHWGPS